VSDRGPKYFALIVAALAIGWRLVGITDWPSPAYRTLQYESALASRAVSIDLFGSDDPRASEWRDAVGSEFFLAPPVLPFLTALANHGLGEEAPWVSRGFTIAFWLLAGFVVRHAILRATGSEWGAAAGFAWFALSPFGQVMSRSFQTESLLAFAFAVGIAIIARPYPAATWRRTLVMGIACGAIAVLKPGIVFAPLALGYTSSILPRSIPGTIGRKLLHTALFTLLLILPGTLYALSLLRPHSGRIMPQLLGEGWYYLGVWFNLRETIGIGIMLLALTGLGVAARAGRLWLPALVLGHFLTLAIFTYHAATHDYYQVPLIIVAAIAIGEATAFVERSCGRKWAAFLAGSMLMTLVVSPDADIGPFRCLPENRERIRLEADERHRHAVRAEAIGRITGVRDRVVELTEVYGFPLRFHGWVQTIRWPSIAERDYMHLSGAISGEFSAEAYLRHIVRDANGRWFVVTDFVEWNRQPDLKAALASFGEPISPVDGVLIFDLRTERR
jgi:hypothetical protein